MTPRNGLTIGIDFGTMNSVMAQLDYDGRPVLLRNSDGNPTTPSAVRLGGSGHVIVGPSSETICAAPPGECVEAIKRQIGSKKWIKLYKRKRLTPEFIVALILKKLKQDAEKCAGPITNLVVTVPASLDEPGRKAMRDAARISGTSATDLISEPAAAGLAFHWMQDESSWSRAIANDRLVVIFDVGAGAFCASFVRLASTEVQVLATDGDSSSGGISWTDRITEYVTERFWPGGVSEMLADPGVRLQLSHACERAKCGLGEKSEIQVELRQEEQFLSVKLTLEEVERIGTELVDRLRHDAETFLRRAETFGRIDEILLVGGGTRMRAVSKALAGVCGQVPLRNLEADRITAQGAAIYAAVLDARQTPLHDRIAGDLIRRLRAIRLMDLENPDGPREGPRRW